MLETCFQYLHLSVIEVCTIQYICLGAVRVWNLIVSVPAHPPEYIQIIKMRREEAEMPDV